MGLADQFLQDAGQKAAPSSSLSAQFAADAAAPMQSTPAVAPTSGSVLSQIGDAANAFGHHLMNLPHGGAQLVENIAAGLAQKVAPDSKIANAIASTAMRDDEAMAQREKDYQAATPNSAGAYAGATVGEIAPFVLSGGLADGVKALGSTVSNGVSDAASKYLPSALSNLAGKMIGGATQGAAISAAAPVTNGGDYATEKGGQIALGAGVGAALPIAGTAISGTYNQLKGALAPLINPRKVVQDALVSGAENSGVSLDKLAAALRNPDQFVPGSTPTTAQAGATPFLVQAEKTLANNPNFKPAFEDLANQNNLARIAQLNDVAGQPGTLDQLTQARGDTARQMYQQAFDQGVDPDAMTPWLKGQVTQLLKRPAMQSAMSDAKTLAQNEGLQLDDSNSVQGLHYAKMALDDQISRAVRVGDNNSVRALADTKDKLLMVLGKMSPAYTDAMQTYAGLSKPINSMEAGTQIINKLSGGALNSAGDPQINLAGYKSALAQALKGSQYGVQPDAEAALRAIQDDLQRASISNSIKVPGSDTAFNLQAPSWLGRQMFGDQFSGKANAAKLVASGLGGIAGFLGGGPVAAAGGGAAALAGMQKLSTLGANRVNNALLEALMNPKAAADMIDPALRQNSPLIQNAVAKALMGKIPEAISYEAASRSGQ